MYVRGYLQGNENGRVVTIVNFVPKCHFSFNFQIKILILECRWSSFFIFFIWKGILQGSLLKKKNKKNMDKKLDTPSTLRHGLRDQNQICTRLGRDVSQLSIDASFFKFTLTRTWQKQT